MRYEDASATDFNADQALATSLNANSDVDVILAGQYGPATGNAITGTGTISGIAGADMVGAGASITAIQGAGGTDTSFSGGKLQVAGEHGVLTIDAQGNYSYVRNQGSPNGVSDVFTYTLAGRDGDTDLATLTINIGKTPTVVQANAVQVVPGPDGVVTLPPGVELSDIHVVGRNLVIDMPDGTQMIIIDGAVFVPQLVLGTVEVPSTNLAALLIDSEPTPAAGPPQSSGGNFAVPVAPLDPGVPLGDLIPPTELAFTPPTFEEVAQPVEEEDEIVLITDLTPAVSGGDVIVDEDDLSDGSDTSKESLTVAGTFTLIAPDGVDTLTVGSLNVIVNGNFQAGATLTTPLGNTLTITGYNAATGVVSYSYTLLDNEAHASGAGENSLFEDFLVTLTDEDGDVDTDTLSVNIVDDVPTANDDVAQLIGGGPISVTLDVDTNDVPGADGTASRNFASLTGTYGNLTLNADGTQTYTLSASGIAVMNNLPEGQTLTDTFNYTLTDGDGDSDPATLVVTLVGNDHPVLITNLTPSVNGGDAIVDEDDLPDGSDTSKEPLTVTGDFTISAPDGVDDLTVGGVQVIINGVFQPGATGLTPLGNTLTITGYNAATGVVSYSYTLNDNETHPNANGQNSIFEDLTVSLSDQDGDVDTDTLSVQIVDDVPTANDDAFSIFEGDADNAITFDVDLNDVPGADGTASRIFTSLTGTYGNLTLNGDGTQTYTLNAAGVLAINALAPGATLQDNFSYTLTDGDGDADPANLVITLTGTDDPPVITGLNPSAEGGDAIVDEDDLPDGSDTSKESLTVTGDFTISAPDGINDLTVGGINVIIDGVFQAGASGATPLGNTITFTGYNAATGVVSYSYTLLDNEAHANANGENSLFDDMAVVLTDTDNDIANATLSVQIVDDVPVANDDAFTIFEDDADNAITFDVDLNDVPGADGTASRNFTSLVGTYGNLTLNGDGTQTYTLNAAGVLAINGLAPGATLQDNFSYTLTDGDGDSDPANLVITLTGTDDPPVITNLTPSAQGGDAIVDEDDLPDGSDTSKESLTVTGDFTISAPDGINDLTVNGINVFIDGVFQAGATGGTPLGNTITFTGYNAATGVVSYSYTLLDNEAHANANGENSLFDDMAVVLTDTDNDIANGTLSVQIVDDVPTANDDAFTIFEGDADNAITFDVDLNDVPGADGTASRVFTSLTGTYGNLTLNGDGTQTYTLNAVGVLAINGLAPGATLQDNFTYTLTDGDGDADPATLIITLSGTDDPPVITGLNPSTNGGDAIVDEDDLVPDGSDPTKESVTVTGDFTISAPDGVNDLTVGGINVIIDGVFQVGATGATPLGNTITFTGYNAATGVVSYSYTLLDNETHPAGSGENSIFDNMSVILSDTDNDVDTDTLSVQIVDDIPTANDDAFTIFEGDADNAITFDVDLNDVPGADGTASRNFTSLVGTYGNLTLNGDGTQTYTLTAFGIAQLNALGNGATLQDNFSYTLTDGDGDSDPANLVITLQGTDDPVLITNLTPSAQGGDVSVDEDDLADGSDTSKESLTVNGDFTISAPDGVDDLTVGGFNVIVNGVFQPGSHVTPLGNTLTFISYVPATGVVSYSYTLNDNETHPNANGQNAIFEDFAVVLTDVDGSTDTDTLSVQIVDDVPTANDDAASQGAENSPVVVNVIANDVQGADGVDIDNNPAVRVEVVAGTLTGAGGLVYNNNGTFTYTPAPGEEGIVTFDYRITDGDGDSDIATVTITLDADSVPIVTAEVARSDDDGLTGGNAAGTGDIDANVGEEVVVNPSEAVFHGDIDVNFGGDTGTVSFSNLHNTAGVVGTENVNYTWAGNTLTATTVGGSRPGTALFQIVVNNAATGDYTLTQLDNILHAAGSDENSTNVVLNYRAADSDGDVDTTGTLTITFNDDTPSINSVTTPLNIANSGTVSGTGNFAFAVGADTNTGGDDIVGTPTFSATVNGNPVNSSSLVFVSEDATSAVFNITFNYNTGPSSTATDTGTLTFNKTTGQYTVDLVNPIVGFSIVQTSDPSTTFVESSPEVTTAQLGTNLFVQFTGMAEPGSGTGNDNLRTIDYDPNPALPNPSPELPPPGAWVIGELFNQVAATVQVSSSAAGVSGNTVQQGEVLDFNLYNSAPGATPGNFPTASSSTMFMKFDTMGGTEDMIVVLKLWTDTNGNGTIDTVGDTFTTRALIIQASDIITGPGTGPGAFSTITLDNNDGLVIIESNDYNAAGESFQIVGAQIINTSEGVTGTGINYVNGTGAGSASNVANSGTYQAFSTIDDSANFKISSIGFLTQSTTAQSAQLTFGVTIQDGDGDTVQQTLVVNVGTPAPPVVLDMDNDGVEFLDQSAGVAYDYNGDGVAEATGWAGADDAILVRDANGNGMVDNASEFVFGGNGVTDLEALAAQYGDTLDASDADFASFAVWQDANSNGVADAGELVSLTDAGIASISLVSDGVAYAAANGDVQVAGTGSFTWADGSTGSLADAAFVTEQRNAANTNTAMIAALAAAGVAASSAAAQTADLGSASTVAIAAALVASNGSALVGKDDVSRPALGNETREAVVDNSSDASSSASSSGDQSAGGNSLTADNGQSPDSQPVDLLQGTEAAASISVESIVAPMVSMPSAEALIAASLNGNAADGSQSNAVVGKVLADALEGGGADASVDALLNALPAQGLGGNAAVEALASQPGAAVSAWDMGPMGGLSANANFTMEALALHHDAVQSVANG